MDLVEKFKFFSENNVNTQEKLRPGLFERTWEDLDDLEKIRVWNHLKPFLRQTDSYNYGAIYLLNKRNKYNAFAKRFLESGTPQNAIYDFKEIFVTSDQSLFIELLDCFCVTMISSRKDRYFERITEESEEDYNDRCKRWGYEEFDKFKEEVNSVFSAFGINLYLTRAGFVFSQETKIMLEIYDPVLEFLSNKERWKKVNELLKEAFDSYKINTPQGYSICITHAIAAVEAFLQLLVEGKVGSSQKMKTLMQQAINKKLIPNDIFAKQVFSNLNSILAAERKRVSAAHPSMEYANIQNAQVVLNLVMVFLQYCIKNN